MGSFTKYGVELCGFSNLEGGVIQMPPQIPRQTIWMSLFNERTQLKQLLVHNNSSNHVSEVFSYT